MQKDVSSLGLTIEMDSELQKTKLHCQILPALQNLKKRNIPPKRNQEIIGKTIFLQTEAEKNFTQYEVTGKQPTEINPTSDLIGKYGYCSCLVARKT